MEKITDILSSIPSFSGLSETQIGEIKQIAVDRHFAKGEIIFFQGDEGNGFYIIISGMVQGVGFRYFVYRKAGEYNLKGYVRNLYNEDVEIEVEGDKGMILDFIKDLKLGPRSAHITGVNIEWLEYKNNYPDFQIKF